MRSLFLVPLLSGWMVGIASAAEVVEEKDPPPYDLRSRMTVEEFERAGLGKLTPEELAALNDWLDREFTAARQGDRPATPQAVTPPLSPSEATLLPPATQPNTSLRDAERDFGLPSSRHEPDMIRARIVGEFTGWEGKTEFVLDNGQVWQQAKPDKYYYRASNPEVMIEKTWLGGYRLRLVETKRAINVIRVK